MSHDAAAPLLSVRLRDATRDEHRRAERRPLVRDLLTGAIERPTYALLLRNLHVVYDRLEEGFDRASPGEPALAAFAPREVRRREALEADLRFFQGPDWDALPPASAAVRFARRLDSLARHDPLLLVAHAYVRYLGDLSGGAVMGRTVARHFDLDDDEGAGLDFYRFPRIDDPESFKNGYRRALDSLGPAGREADLVDEARASFRLNQELFDAVDATRHSRPD